MKARGAARTIDAKIGRAISVRRVWVGMNQGGLAKRANLDPSAISLIEAGARSVSIDSLYRIAAVLRVEPSELLPAPPKRKSR